MLMCLLSYILVLWIIFLIFVFTRAFHCVQFSKIQTVTYGLKVIWFNVNRIVQVTVLLLGFTKVFLFCNQ